MVLLLFRRSGEIPLVVVPSPQAADDDGDGQAPAVGGLIGALLQRADVGALRYN
jgi:hypothetical protein